MVNRKILLINSDNSDVTYAELAEYHRRYPNADFWVNQCSYKDYSFEKEQTLLSNVAKLDQVFILNAGKPLAMFDDLVLCVIAIARRSDVQICYYTDEEVSIR